MLQQCTCSAFFATDDDLCDHLDEYRVSALTPESISLVDMVEAREARLRAELETCQMHSRANGGTDAHMLHEYNHRDNSETDDTRRKISKNGSPSGHFCPSCERLEPFKKMQGLRRHFEQRK